MKNFTSNLIKTIGFIAVVFFVAFVFSKAFDRVEKVECMKWQSQASEFVGFYLTKAQAEQCTHHNIIVNAEVR